MRQRVFFSAGGGRWLSMAPQVGRNRAPEGWWYLAGVNDNSHHERRGGLRWLQGMVKDSLLAVSPDCDERTGS
jgi:hypothetical protein